MARIDGGRVTSDGGGLVLKEVEDRLRFIERFAGCFTDCRDPDLLEHPLVDLLKQRIFGLCPGYEDLLDHDTLRYDALLAVLVGKDDPLHGRQFGRFFHGYYDAYCDLPLYVFCGDHPLLALLRRA